MMGRTDLLILEDNHIRGIMTDPRMLLLIPCLGDVDKGLTQRLRECQKCKKKRNVAVADAMTRAKSCLTSLPAAKRATFKALLNARQVRLVKRNSRGVKVVVTF